ncbi:MAG: aminotransferase class IV [Chitinophagaceae bacterium]|nr:aminotransferase class IV [Chitinophagaceae bacterium]
MADNRGYRYGDGLFETMKVIKGKILLESYHFERLFKGLKLLQFTLPALLTPAMLRRKVLALASRNKCERLGRVRLSIYRGHGGLYDSSKAQYLIECWPVEETVNRINENGQVIDIFPNARKSCDLYSNLKSANFLTYSMAAQYAMDNKLNDCLVSNVMGHLADATIANLFLVKNKLVITPSLAEGCVEGVMRRHLIDRLKDSAFDVREGVVTKNDLETFEEAFLTNTMYGIRWVGRFRKKIYTNHQTLKIYRDFVTPLFS